MFDKLNDFQNRAPGAVAVLTIPTNRTVDKIHLRLPAGVTKDKITRIEGKINDRRFFEDTGANVTIRDNYLSGNGSFVDPQVITLDFTEPGARGGAPEQYLTSLPANLMKSLKFEITIDPSVSVANAGAIIAECDYRGPTTNPFVMRRQSMTQALSFIGENDLILPNGQAGGLIKRMWIHHTGHIKAAEIRADNSTKNRWTDLESMAYGQKRHGYVPQANLHVLDFVQDGNLMAAYNTRAYTENLLRLTTDAADQARIYVDFIDHIKAI